MKTSSSRIVAVFALLVAGALTSACESTEKNDVDELIATFETLRVEASIPGLAVAVVRDGEVVAMTGLGHANLQNEVPVTVDTPFRIASVTKPLAATLALMLEARGVIDLDTPMSEYEGFDEFCAAARERGGLFFDDWACDDPRMTLRHVFNMTVNEPLGERFFYNPVVYSWGSRPIMSVTGESYSHLVAANIFEPVGMTRSARTHRDLQLPDALAKDLATPYHIGEDGTLVESEPPGPQGDGAAGGIISTVRDLAAFDIALDSGKLIDDAAREEMWTAAGPNIPYGIGWFVKELDGEYVVWHTGLWEEKYSALYLKVPAKNYSLILLANSDGLRWESGLDEAVVERSPFARAFLEMIADD